MDRSAARALTDRLISATLGADVERHALEQRGLITAVLAARVPDQAPACVARDETGKAYVLAAAGDNRLLAIWPAAPQADAPFALESELLRLDAPGVRLTLREGVMSYARIWERLWTYHLPGGRTFEVRTRSEDDDGNADAVAAALASHAGWPAHQPRS